MAHKLLIVEDETIQILMLRLHLEAAGFEVLAATSGEEGLQMAREGHPDLILLDVILPGLTGLEICQQLKAAPETQGIRVLLVTASNMKNFEQRARLFGADGVITKPYEPQALIARVRALLALKAQKPSSS